MKAMVMSLVFFVSATCVAQNTVKTNYDNGAVKTEYVKQRDRVAVTSYYTDGTVKETGYFKDGIPDGTWKTFSKNGVKTAELTYVDGQRQGEFRVWDEFANAYIEILYEQGRIVTANRYLKETEFAAKGQ